RAGRNRYCILTRSCIERGGNPRIQSDGVTPPGGNQFRIPEKTRIRTIPMKKVGREKVVSEITTEPVSKRRPRLAAATTPRNIPIIRAIVVETPSRKRVLASLPVLTISASTGFPVCCEVPKLNVIILTKYTVNLSQTLAGIHFPLASKPLQIP